MGLPEPTVTFTIPSIHDNTALDCRLHVPTGSLNAGTKKAAIVAHPYAPLGGCYDDHVVEAVCVEFLKDSFTVCTFNFRGAGGSQGSTSWSGKPEVADYSTVIGFMVYFMAAEGDEMTLQLTIGGYSYGSIIASHTPGHEEILDRFRNADEGSAYNEIIKRAHHLFMEVKHSSASEQKELGSSERKGRAHTYGRTLQVGGKETPADSRRRSGEPRRLSAELRHSLDLVRRLGPHPRKESHEEAVKPQQSASCELPNLALEVSYLLVSPLLPPASLIAFSLAHGQRQNQALVTRLSQHSSLAVYGSSDIFTSARRLKPWAHGVASRPGSRFTYVEVEAAGHFWHEHGADSKLRIAVREWIKSL